MKGKEIEIEIGKVMEGTIQIDSLLELAMKIQEEANPELAILREIEENQKEEEKEDKMKEFTRIVKGVAKKYAISNFGIEKDDLEQDLWVKVFEFINSNGGIENVNGKMIARCCWNEAVDKYRYHRRRRDSKAEYLEGTDDDIESSSTESSISHSKFNTGYDSVIVKEVIELFPKGSKERKYVVTKLYMYGEIEEEDIEDEGISLPENDTEEAILKLLGYKSKYPASWGAKKNEMRDKVYRYLGKYDEIESCENREKAIEKRIDQMFRETKDYWIYLNKISKDKVMKFLKAENEEIIEIVGKSNKLAIAIDHTNGETYILKNEKTYINHIIELGDRVIL